MTTPRPCIEPRYLKLKDLVAEYGASMSFWRREIWRGHLPVVRLGCRHIVVARVDIEAYMQRCRSTAAR